MAEFNGEVVTRDNLKEFNEWISSNLLDGDMRRDINISPDVPFSEISIKDIRTEAGRSILKDAVINAMNEAFRNNRAEIFDLWKNGKYEECLPFSRADELLKLSQNHPEFVSKVIKSLGNSPVGISRITLYDIVTEGLKQRPVTENFKLAQYVDISYDMGKETDIKQFSKEEKIAFNQLWQEYENYKKYQHREDACSYAFLGEVLKRGDLLNCKDLTPNQRDEAINKYLSGSHSDHKKILQKIEESYINKDLALKVLSYPNGYLGEIKNEKGIFSEEYQKITKAMMRIVSEMPKYDQSRYGYEKGLTERFDELLKENKNFGKTFEDLPEDRSNFFIKAMYLKVAQKDIENGHADKLPPYALREVLASDTKGYYARKISPEIYRAKMTQLRQEGKSTSFNNEQEAEFLIYRNEPKTAGEMKNIAESSVFKKLSKEEQDIMLRRAEFFEKINLMGLNNTPIMKDINTAFEMTVSGKGKEPVYQGKTAEEFISSIEDQYSKMKENYKLKVEQKEKIQAVSSACRKDFMVKKDAENTIKSLQSIYKDIVSNTKSNPPKAKEEELRDVNVEKLILDVVSGSRKELLMPDEGGLPLFGRKAEETRRDKLQTQIYKFNEILKNISYQSDLREELKKYEHFLDQGTYEQISLKRAESEQTVDEVNQKINQWEIEFSRKPDKENKYGEILRYSPIPVQNLEIYPVSELKHMYDFLEQDAKNQKSFDDARLEIQSYEKAVKKVAHERVGVDENSEVLPVVEKGQGKKTHEQRTELKYVLERKDKLETRKNGKKAETKETQAQKINKARSEISQAQRNIKAQEQQTR